jgi:hypothetical protein
MDISLQPKDSSQKPATMFKLVSAQDVHEFLTSISDREIDNVSLSV